jgi:D-alanyl-lipoteichoic acid acyltransferase DltB (MBOAT superfamily)
MNQLLADKRVAWLLIIGGIVLAVLSVVIDPIRGYDIHMAAIQIVVLIVGIIAILIGLYLGFVRRPAPPSM